MDDVNEDAPEEESESVESVESEESEEAESGAPASDRNRLLIIVGVVAVLGLIGTLVFGFLWNQERSDDAAQQSMENRASDFLLALFEFDGSTIDADFDDVTSYATGDFADQAETVFGDDETRAALREYQAASRAEVRDLFVQSFDGDKGTVFAVVDQTIANNQNPQPRSDQVRVEVTMRKVDGEWKVSALDVLSAPVASAAVDAGIIPGTTPTTAPTATTTPG